MQLLGLRKICVNIEHAAAFMGEHFFGSLHRLPTGGLGWLRAKVLDNSRCDSLFRLPTASVQALCSGFGKISMCKVIPVELPHCTWTLQSNPSTGVVSTRIMGKKLIREPVVPLQTVADM